MYYVLNRDYLLRGWQGLACALVKRPEYSVKFIPAAEYKLLLLCDGESELDITSFGMDVTSIFEKYIDKGVINVSEVPFPLDEEQIYVKYDSRYCEQIQWSITGRCNYRCRHCYMDGGGRAGSGRQYELSKEEIFKIADRFEADGIFHVELTGGEPFVRSDFWEIIDYLREKHIVVDQIYTNGWLLDDDVFDKFEKRSMKPAFSISFDGIGWHDWMRGIEGAEDAVKYALELCKRRGFKTNVEMCLHKGNAPVLAETIEYLAGVTEYVRIGAISSNYIWKENCEGYDMSYEEFISSILEYVPKYFAAGCPVNILAGSFLMLHKTSGKYEIVAEQYDGSNDCEKCLVCDHAKYRVYIAPDGTRLPCIAMLGVKQCIQEDLHTLVVNTRISDLFEKNEECAGCEHRHFCGGGCRASALETDGHFYGCDRYQCLLFKGGYLDKIKEVIKNAREGR